MTRSRTMSKCWDELAQFLGRQGVEAVVLLARHSACDQCSAGVPQRGRGGEWFVGCHGYGPMI